MFVATRLRRAVRAAHDSGNLYVGGKLKCTVRGFGDGDTIGAEVLR